MENSFIGIDLSFVRPDHKNGGTETFIKNLMHGFERIGVSNQIRYFIHEDVYEEYKREYKKSKFIVYKIKGNHKFRMLYFQTFCLSRLVNKYQIKLVYEPSYASGLRIKTKYKVASNPEDLQHKFYPQYFGKLQRLYINTMVWLTFKKSNKVIAISKYAEGTFHQFYPDMLNGKTETLYLPVRFYEGNSTKIDGIEGKYILSVNAIRKNKNLITLVKAYERICERIEEKLVLVGVKLDETDALSMYIKEHKLNNKVTFTGYVSDSQLKWLYENASVFVTASLYEGFGMTPVEAMGYGCPVISSKDTSLYEVTKGVAEYYEPTMDDEVLSKTIMDVVSGKRRIDMKKNKILMRETYDIETISRKYFECFNGIISCENEINVFD